MTRITRIEVIDENGRSYVSWEDNNDVQLSYQDDGRTLKVFVNKESKMTLKDEGKFYFVHYNDKLYHRMEYTHIPIVWWFENVNTLEKPVPLHKKVMDGELIKTLEQLYQEQIVEETAQERGERIHKEVEELLSNDEKSPLDLIKEWAEKNKPQTLYQILMKWWINDDWTDQTDESIIDNLVDLIDDQFIPPHHDTNDYKWNQCLKLMREKLR